jgi:hypothetical protein
MGAVWGARGASSGGKAVVWNFAEARAGLAEDFEGEEGDRKEQGRKEGRKEAGLILQDWNSRLEGSEAL